MRKLSLLLLGSALTLNATAQDINVTTEHKTLVMKYTADWCPPCGATAWNWAEELIDGAKDGSINAVVVAVHNSNSNQSFLNIKSTYNSLRSNLDSNVSGIPSFIVSKENMAQSNATIVKAKIASVTSSAPEVNAGFMPTWNPDGSLKVDVKTTFFKDATGTYSVAIYLYETEVSAKQYNQGTGAYPNSTPVMHKNIMRTPNFGGGSGMTTAFGTEISGTSFKANESFTNTFNFAVDAGWDKSKINAFVTVWKKNGSQWEVANASPSATFPTNINAVKGDVIAGVYPNPANDKFIVSFGSAISNCTISMVDVTGKKVAELYQGKVDPNTVGITLNRPQGLTSGLYYLQINSDKGTQSMKIILQ